MLMLTCVSMTAGKVTLTKVRVGSSFPAKDADADLRQHDCRYQNVSLTKVRVGSSFPAKDADADLRQHDC
ncbi:hypothetical protein [Fibrobacter sp. UWP2]|uniref:hypothetical protein n=1 Tax=Fibrobacter sp. UWP2 TaxID=1896216 RepID=UPI00116091CE|nr:hypothetical protein [Fibrobacter sp. UWP2]